VISSWERCLSDFGLRPASRTVEVVLEDHSISERREQMGELYDIARTEMENLYLQTAGSGYAVILTDRNGAIVDRIGDPTLDREFVEVGLWPGADWSESCAGTNGIGTCIQEARPITIHRDDHFLSCNIGMSCSGTPICGPDGDMLAVLDASSVNSRDTRESQLHTMALVKMSARLIENSNFLRMHRSHWVVRFHVRPEFVGLLNEGMLAVDGNGTITAANPSAVGQLARGSRYDVVGHSIDEILDLSPVALQVRSLRQSEAIWPVRERAHGKRYFATLRGPVSLTPGRSQGGRIVCTGRSESVPDTLSLERLVAGGDPRVAYSVRCAERLVDKDIPIILHGETGTGKEAMAQAIHGASSRRDRPFVAINCASIPASLIESELFGYKGGAFTGARKEGMRGKILQASGGTLFLDEIGDMPPELQTRLLRVLEQREVVALGSERPEPVDLHVISATHRNLEVLVREGDFREDLYYRLNGMTLTLPALRERRDKERLIRAVLSAENDEHAEVSIDRDAFAQLREYHWPGNIRQLRNVLRTALALCDDGLVQLADLPPEIIRPRASESGAVTPYGGDAPKAPVAPSGQESDANSLEAAERDALLRELERHRWNVSGTATALGTSRNTLYRKMRKHGINPSRAD